MDKTDYIIAVFVAILLGGIFLPFLTYFDTYTNPVSSVQTLMRTLFPIAVIIGGAFGAYALLKRKNP